MDITPFSQSMITNQSGDCGMDSFVEEEGIDVSLLPLDYMQPVSHALQNENDHLLKEHEIFEASPTKELFQDPKHDGADEIPASLTMETQRSDEAIEIMLDEDEDEDEGQEVVYNPESKNRNTNSKSLNRKCFFITSSVVILLVVIVGCLWGTNFKDSSGSQGTRNSTEAMKDLSNPTSEEETSNQSTAPTSKDILSSPTLDPTYLRAPATSPLPTSVPKNSEGNGNPSLSTSLSSNEFLSKLLQSISGTTLENEDSPQSIAALSLSKEVEKYNSQYLSSNQDAIIQRFILLILVFSLSNEKPTWIELNECSWNFTTCTSEGIIESLKMVNMNLSGKIPREISYLSYLTTLDMSSNNLKGSLPDDLFSMRSLKHLYLDKNQLTGSLSPSIGSMTKLESLFLGENEFTGLIPETLPSSLRYISLYKNKFDGMIPRLFLKSNNRFYVDLSQNELAGTLPKNAASSNLRHLYLSHNQLWGSIPRSYSLMDLENLYLDHNQFTGHIPSDFSKKFLSTLQIQSNLFPADAIDDNLCELDAFRDGLLIDLHADCYLCHCSSRLCEKCS